MRAQSGFTLIETIIYIALFAIVMGGAVVSMYTLFESTARSSARAQLEEEGNYLVQKVDWYLSQTKIVEAPTASGGVLSVTLSDNSLVTIDVHSGDLRLQEDSSAPVVLNNSNVSLSNLSFVHDSADNLESVSVSFVLTAKTSDGHSLAQLFTAMRYLSQ